MNKTQVVVKQDEEKPIATEIIAKAIVDISAATNKMLAAGLKQETIVILVSSRSGISKKNVNIVINCLSSLREIYCTR